MADHRAHVVYRRLLSLTGHGYPLWIPDPDENLPEAYRNIGISIGDVGLLTEDGGFDFLFNVHTSTNDAASGGVSWDVLPLAAFNDAHPIRKTSFIHKEKSAITSAHVTKKSIAMEGSTDTVVFGGGGFGFQFSTKKAQAAVLMLPGGAHRYEAKNHSIYEKYASENGLAWYKYANFTLGRGAMNGSLYLVTGCDKCRSWGTAAVSQPEETRDVSLKFVAAGMTEGGIALHSSWSTELGTEARCFPPNSLPIPNLENQCVFVRGLTIAVKESLLRRSVRVEVDRWSGGRKDSRHRFFGLPSSAFPRSSHSFSSSGPSGHSSSSYGRIGHSQLGLNSRFLEEQALQFDSDGESDNDTSDSEVEVSRFPLYSAEPHISSRLANHVVSTRSDVDIAVVDDEAWMSVVNEDYNSQMERHPDMLQVFQQVLKSYVIDVSDGVARLRQHPKVLDAKATISSNADEGTTLMLNNHSLRRRSSLSSTFNAFLGSSFKDGNSVPDDSALGYASALPIDYNFTYEFPVPSLDSIVNASSNHPLGGFVPEPTIAESLLGVIHENSTSLLSSPVHHDTLPVLPSIDVGVRDWKGILEPEAADSSFFYHMNDHSESTHHHHEHLARVQSSSPGNGTGRLG